MPDNAKLDYIQERVDTVVDRVADVGKSMEGLKTAFELHVERNDKLHESVSVMAETLRANTNSLNEHMRRTDILEHYVKSVDARFTPLEVERTRKKAVNVWVSAQLKLSAKIGGAVAAAGTVGMAAKHLIEYILTH